MKMPNTYQKKVGNQSGWAGEKPQKEYDETKLSKWTGSNVFL